MEAEYYCAQADRSFESTEPVIVVISEEQISNNTFVSGLEYAGSVPPIDETIYVAKYQLKNLPKDSWEKLLTELNLSSGTIWMDIAACYLTPQEIDHIQSNSDERQVNPMELFLERALIINPELSIEDFIRTCCNFLRYDTSDVMNIVVHPILLELTETSTQES